MKLRKVSVYRIKIPLRQKFKHASAQRVFAENIIVRIDSDNGISGWGETIPREYVTGETLDGTMTFYKRFIPQLIGTDIRSVDDIKSVLSGSELNGRNCARCAIELALLDLLAKESGQPLYRYLADNISNAKVFSEGPFFYGGAIGLGDGIKTVVSALKMLLFGFKHVKLKLEKNLPADIKRLKLTRLILSRQTGLRVDANEAWDMDYAKNIAPYLDKYNVCGVEQPFMKDMLELNNQFKKIADVKIIFDESLCTIEQAKQFATDKTCDVFCVKLPKTGGVLNALEIFDIARKENIPVQLSCQVGETAILSAAGRHMAALCPTLRYLEGSFDKFLLAQNVCGEDITFGFKGKADLIRKSGIGIDVDPQKVKCLAVETIQI